MNLYSLIESRFPEDQTAACLILPGGSDISASIGAATGRGLAAESCNVVLVARTQSSQHLIAAAQAFEAR